MRTLSRRSTAAGPSSSAASTAISRGCFAASPSSRSSRLARVHRRGAQAPASKRASITRRSRVRRAAAVRQHLPDPYARAPRRARGDAGRIGSWLAPNGRLFVATRTRRRVAPDRGENGPHRPPAAVTPAEAAHGHRVTYSLDTFAADARGPGLAVRARGGVFFKGLANFQLDAALSRHHLRRLPRGAASSSASTSPELCSSVYVVCEPPTGSTGAAAAAVAAKR